MASTPGVGQRGPDGRSPEHKRDRREVVRIVVAAVALIFLIAFVLDNSQTVKVGFVFGSTQISLIWALLIAAVLGALVDRLIIWLNQRRKRSAKSGP